MRTSFHHQPEAQHPKSPAIYTPAGRLPHLSGVKRTSRLDGVMSAFDFPDMTAIIQFVEHHAPNDAESKS